VTAPAPDAFAPNAYAPGGAPAAAPAAAGRAAHGAPARGAPAQGAPVPDAPSPEAHALFAAGRLEAAIERLGAELRARPDDARRRTFLFELLAFAGQYERAHKQLAVLAGAGGPAEAGAIVYRAALEAERVREHMFASGDLPAAPAPPAPGGTLNGRRFAAVADADPRVGARLEVMAGGRYLWIPFAHLAAVRVEAPARLRDLRWATARVATGPAVRDLELGEVLLPALTPAAWRHADPDVRLGRAADWEEGPGGEFRPVGQKLLLVDGAPVPLVDVRDLTFDPPAAAAA
jgi:type VI secretion system protein ImpE